MVQLTPTAQALADELRQRRAERNAQPAAVAMTNRLTIHALEQLTVDPNAPKTAQQLRLADLQAENRLPLREKIRKRKLDAERAEMRDAIGWRHGKSSRRGKFDLDTLGSKGTGGIKKKSGKPKPVMRLRQKKPETILGKRGFEEMVGKEYGDDAPPRPMKKLRDERVRSSVTANYRIQTVSEADITELYGVFERKATITGEIGEGVGYSGMAFPLLSMMPLEVESGVEPVDRKMGRYGSYFPGEFLSIEMELHRSQSRRRLITLLRSLPTNQLGQTAAALDADQPSTPVDA